jgi:signal transduction histidine kinase
MQRLSAWMQHYYPRVNTRITAPFLAITMIVAALGVFIVTRLVSSSIDERINNQLLTSAQAASNALAQVESEQLSALRALVFTEGIPEAISSNDIETLNERLTPIIVNNQLDVVIVFDTAQTPIYSVSFDSFNGQLSVLPLADNFVLEGVGQILRVDLDEQGDKWVDILPVTNGYLFYITAPVLNEENLIVGAIAIGFNSNNVLRRLTEQALANLTLYDNTGRILASSYRNDPTAIVLANDLFMRLKDETQRQSPILDSTINATPYRVLYVPLVLRSQTIGLLATALPTDFVVDQISVSRNVFIVFFGALFFVVTIIGVGITRSIVLPITELVATTRAIQDGDLSRRVGLKLPDEIGELSLSFDAMTDRLVQRNEQVEDLYARQLEETARRDAILSSITDAVIVRGQKGNVVLLNPAAERLLEELQRDELTFGEFMALQWQPQLLSKPRNVSFANKHFSVLATPVFMEKKTLLGHIIVFRDITVMVEAERLKDEMILQLSHELRTPLSSVRGYVELLQLMNAPSFDKQSKSFVAKTIEQLNILERMVNQVIDVSAILAEEIELELERINVAELIDEIVQETQERIRAKNQRLSLSLPSFPVLIDADPRQLRQVFEHVMRNAHSYTFSGGWIEIQLDADTPNSISIYFIDNGVGIASDEIGHVFERMYRGRSADAGATDTRGLGLGLFLSKEIVEAHHGSISIDSKPNMGTIVNITLPRAQTKQ